MVTTTTQFPSVSDPAVVEIIGEMQSDPKLREAVTNSLRDEDEELRRAIDADMTALNAAAGLEMMLNVSARDFVKGFLDRTADAICGAIYRGFRSNRIDEMTKLEEALRDGDRKFVEKFVSQGKRFGLKYMFSDEYRPELRKILCAKYSPKEVDQLRAIYNKTMASTSIPQATGSARVANEARLPRGTERGGGRQI